MSQHEQTYSASSSAAALPKVLRAMARGMIESPYMAYRLVVKDVKATYSKSAFGMVWDLVDPLVLGIVFYTLRKNNIIDVGELTMPYALYVIYGLLMYATFSESLIASTEMLTRSKGLLSQLKVSPEALILSVLFRVLFNSSFRIVVILGFSLALGAYSMVGFVKFVLLYGTIILAGISIGLALAPFHTIYNDVGRLARIVITPLRYVSPVMWPIPNAGVFAVVNLINPITPILNNLRLLATSNEAAELVGFSVRCGIYGVLFLAAWLMFHLAVPVLADRA